MQNSIYQEPCSRLDDVKESLVLRFVKVLYLTFPSAAPDSGFREIIRLDLIVLMACQTDEGNRNEQTCFALPWL